MYSVCALGELLVDFTDAGFSKDGMRLFEQNPGGAPANVLCALSRLGHRTAFLGKVGRDMHGDFLRKTLEAAGVDIRGLIVANNVFTTLAFVSLGAGGERTFSFARKPGADTCITPEEISYPLIENSRIFHVGSLSMTDEPARSATIAALEHARSCGRIISYDPNYRASLWRSSEEAIGQMRALIPYADLVKISDEECTLLSGASTPEEAARRICACGPRLAAVTCGGKGAYVYLRKSDVCDPQEAPSGDLRDTGTPSGMGRFVEGFSCAVKDTTGAGDAFWGGFLAAFCEARDTNGSGYTKSTLGELSLEDASSFCRFGNATAALCIQKRGGIPAMPERKAVEELLGSSE